MDEEVYLRPLTITDASVSWRWRNDVDLWKFTGSRPDRPITEQIEREWAKKVIADPTRINYAICLKPSGRYIGNIYLIHVKDGMGELGIFIGNRDCHGKGYAQKALSLLKEIVSRDYGIKKIHIRVRKENAAALVVYLKAGGEIEDTDLWIHLTLDTCKNEVNG